MTIGEILYDRMSVFNLDANALAEISFVDDTIINNLLSDTMLFEELDDFDKEMICNALYCDKEYFVNEQIRKRDIISSSLNRGGDTPQSILVKGRIQSFLSDYIFIKDILNNI